MDTPWANVLTAVLEQNFDSLQRAVNNIGQDLQAFKNEYLRFTAGESLAAGDVCVLNASGQMVKADASAESTCSSLLALAATAIESGRQGNFLLSGLYTSSDLTPGSPLFVSNVAGTWTDATPAASGEIVRVIGYALSETQVFFQPDRTWTEIA
jgi:hypothetical protein